MSPSVQHPLMAPVRTFLGSSILLGLIAACGPSAGSNGPVGGGGSDSLDLEAPYNNLHLGKPETLPLAGSEGSSGTTEGAAYEVDLTAENVEGVNSHARFRPNWAANTPMEARRLAAAFYFIDLNGQYRPQSLLMNWLAAPTQDNLWVGLADWDENRWVWRKLSDVANIDLPTHSRFQRDSDGFMACVLLVLGTENAVLDDLQIESQEPPALTNAEYPLGVNLELLTDWNKSLVYTDIFKLSRDWIPQRAGTSSPWNTGTPIITDENGWVTSLAPGDSVMAMLSTNQADNYPTGRYTCLYDGDGGTNSNAFLVLGNGSIVPGSGSPGRFEIDITQSDQGSVWFKIDAINPADYIRNIRVIMPGFESTYNTTNVYHPDFLSSLGGFKLFRMMEWAWTKNSTVVTWADRTPPGYCRHTAAKGAPIEAMVQLCNKMQSDMWYSIPHMADDNYVTQAVTLIRDTLNPNLRLFLEYSNEVWNFKFDQAHWAKDQGLLLWPGDQHAVYHYYGYRTAQIMDLASTVFANEKEGRLVRVMAGWSSNPWANQKILDFELTGPSDLAYMHADVFAVAPYFGGPNAPAFTEEEIAAMTVEDVLDISEGYIQDTLAAGSVTEENFELAMTRGLVLVAYEGGQHIAAKSNDIANNTTITALFLAANRHPRMRQMYLDYLTLWSSRSVGPFFHYNHTGSYDKWGSWGLLETQNQSRASAYKWLGVHDWLDTVWN